MLSITLKMIRMSLLNLTPNNIALLHCSPSFQKRNLVRNTTAVSVESVLRAQIARYNGSAAMRNDQVAHQV